VTQKPPEKYGDQLPEGIFRSDLKGENGHVRNLREVNRCAPKHIENIGKGFGMSRGNNPFE
jgi:hypothetical protein